MKSDTHKIEIIEFAIGDTLYAVNIAKVREIIRCGNDIVAVPNAHPSIAGAINLRGKIIPVVNTAGHLKKDTSLNEKKARIIITHLKEFAVGFLVSSVANIHRLSWEDVQEPSDLLQTEGDYTLGIIKIDPKVLFLIDLNKMALDINPA